MCRRSPSWASTSCSGVGIPLLVRGHPFPMPRGLVLRRLPHACVRIVDFTAQLAAALASCACMRIVPAIGGGGRRCSRSRTRHMLLDLPWMVRTCFEHLVDFHFLPQSLRFASLSTVQLYLSSMWSTLQSSLSYWCRISCARCPSSCSCELVSLALATGAARLQHCERWPLDLKGRMTIDCHVTSSDEPQVLVLVTRTSTSTRTRTRD